MSYGQGQATCHHLSLESLVHNCLGFINGHEVLITLIVMSFSGYVRLVIYFFGCG